METVRQLSAVRLRLKIEAQPPDGEVQDPQYQEFEFIYGIEPQPTSLEKVLEGVTAGHRFSVLIPPEELYGDRDSQLIREIPKEGLIKQRVREGQYYRQIRMGSLVEFKVIEIKNDTVLVDFNKPMTGISARIEGEVLEVRQVSQEEIERAQDKQRKMEIGCG